MSPLRIALGSLCSVCGLLIGTAAHPATFQEHYNKYLQYLQKREFVSAIPEGRFILSATEQALGPENPQTGVMALNIGILYSGLGWYERAAAYFDEAHNIIMSTTESSDPRRTSLLKEKALFDLNRGDYEKASDALKQLVFKARANKEKPEKLAALLIVYGKSLRFINLDQSLEAFSEAGDLATQVYGRKDPRVGRIILDMAQAYTGNGRTADARKVYKEALKRYGGTSRQQTWLGYAIRQEQSFLLYREGSTRKLTNFIVDSGLGSFRIGKTRSNTNTPYECRTDANGHINPNHWAYLAYEVDGDGRVINSEVIAANPPLVGDHAILRAMHGLRLPPDDSDSLKGGLSSMRMYIECDPADEDEELHGDSDAIVGDFVKRMMKNVPAPDALREARTKYEALAMAGREEPALDAVEQALAEAIGASDKPDPRIATAWYDYGVILALFGHRGEARAAGRRALYAFETLYSKDDPKLLPVLVLLTSVTGPKGGADYSTRAKAIAKSEGRGDDLRIADLLYSRSAAGRFEQEVDVQHSFDIYAKNPNTDPEEFAARLFRYGRSQFSANYKNAIKAFQRILSGPGASLPPTNPYVRASHFYLAAMLGDEGASPEDIAAANRHADAVGLEPDPAFAALVRTMPLMHMGRGKYPERAQQMGVEGETTVSYRISDEGGIEDAHVVEAFPLGIFDKASLDWIKKWKYPPVMGEVPLHRMTVRIRFRIN